MDLKAYIKDVPNFPKPGVLFKDINPLLKNHKATREAVKRLAEPLFDLKPDQVCGIESRGFLLGILLAYELGIDFSPIRKPGKLPGEVRVQTYNLEYGIDTLEIQQNAIRKGDRIILHDDVLATGGTAAAARGLIEQCGGEIVECNFLLELDDLKGRRHLRGLPLRSLLNF